MNDVILHKKESIERCIHRVRTVYQTSSALPFADDYDRQDVIVLNLIRACEQALDLANYVIRRCKLGLPKSSKESFRILAEAAYIPPHIATTMEQMIGFRNLAVHQYQQLDLRILVRIIEHHLDDVVAFTTALLPVV